MLVLKRKLNTSFSVGGAVIHIQQIRSGEVQIGIDAPREIAILRDDAKSTTARTTPAQGCDHEPAPR